MSESICKRCGISFERSSAHPRLYCSKDCRRNAPMYGEGENRKPVSMKLEKRVSQYKSGAERRNFEWELTYEQCDSLFSSPCYLCGEEGPGGIDRLDNEKGYKPGNVRACCNDCNMMKGILNPVDFLRAVKRICEHADRHNFWAALEQWEAYLQREAEEEAA